MKQKYASSKIYAIVIALALFVLFSLNITYSYFSAQQMVSGSSSMGSIAIGWVSGSYGVGNDITVNPVDSNGNVLESLSRGQIFYGKASNGTVLTNMYISGNEYDTYARFWVDAYIAGNTTNYGRYFELQRVDESKVAKELKTNSTTGETNYIYFVNSAFNAVDKQTGALINGLKIVADAPMEILSNSITVTIHLEGVQATHNAHQAVFNDWKGYLTSWNV